MSWNYRVIEFDGGDDQDPWRAIHEVYYEDGVPVAYEESPAVIHWDLDEDPVEILSLVGLAILKPVLSEHDFKDENG